MSLVSTHLTGLRSAVTAAGAKFPRPVAQAITERDSLVAAANALPAVTTDAIGDAIAAALIEDRDPFVDLQVQRLALAHLIAGSTGDAVAYIVLAAAERRILAALSGHVDPILDTLVTAANHLGTELATAAEVIGDHDLHDHAGILAIGEDAARAWADARAALQQLRIIDAGWLALAELTGFASPSVDPIIRYASVTLDQYEHHGRRPEFWQLIRGGVTIEFATASTITDRTDRINHERERRQAHEAGAFSDAHRRQHGTVTTS